MTALPTAGRAARSHSGVLAASYMALKKEGGK